MDKALQSDFWISDTIKRIKKIVVMPIEHFWNHRGFGNLERVFEIEDITGYFNFETWFLKNQVIS